MQDREQRVSHWAYRIWLAEGQPEGRSDVHHRLAEAMIDMQDADQAAAAAPKARAAPRKKSVKPASKKANAQVDAMLAIEDPKQSPGKPGHKVRAAKNPTSRKDTLRPSPEPHGKAVH
ncbi:DUF2934 domain-containing protein [Lacibacterium aquatile]|uniref:DUF2934 domain-containing protein n=1 Tax=Lacibacterium aquatile TaxID=1168082 RepID=A0ABW5DW81_9PROT